MKSRTKRLIARMIRIRRVMDEAAIARGLFRERLVEDGLRLLEEKGLVVSFFLTGRNSRLDWEGVDAVLYDLDGKEIPFQIKGSKSGVARHRRNHPDIAVIDVGACAQPHEVAHLLQMAFSLFKPLGRGPLVLSERLES